MHRTMLFLLAAKRRALVLLAALTVLGGADLTPAHVHCFGETRVRGIEQTAENRIKGEADVSQETHWENSIFLRQLAAECALAGELQAVNRLKGGIRVTEKGLRILEGHLGQFGQHAPNAAMISRLRGALGKLVTGADANFYLHEISEATLMRGGMSYEAAHAASIAKYQVSPFSLYAPEVIQALPSYFNNAWKSFWGLQ